MYHRGYHGDLNETLYVGEVSDEVKRLVNNTWECLEKAIKEVKPGVKYRDVGNVIQKHAQSEGYAVVRSYCGHGKWKSKFLKIYKRYQKSSLQTRADEWPL